MSPYVNKQSIVNMLNNSTVKELLKKNDLDGLYDYFYN
jgi:hypothetical protein